MGFDALKDSWFNSRTAAVVWIKKSKDAVETVTRLARCYMENYAASALLAAKILNVHTTKF